MRILIALFVVLGVVLAQSAHAGLLKQATKHPFLTGVAVLSVAAIATRAGRRNCASSGAGGIQGLGDSNIRCREDKTQKVGLVDKSKLALLKNQTKELRRSLSANGEKESKGCAAHHIVPQNESRDWAKDDADDARNVLDSCNISIDSAINGVYLPFNRNAECEGANHRKLHTKIYYSMVSRLLLAAHINNCDQVKTQLREIKEALRRNTFNGGVY